MLDEEHWRCAKIDGELLVQPLPGLTLEDQAISDALSCFPWELLDIIPQIGVYHIRCKAIEAELDFARALEATGRFAIVQPNLVKQLCLVPNDTNYGTQTQLAKMNMPAAWDISTGDTKVVLAFLDSGATWIAGEAPPTLVSGYNFVDNNTDISDKVAGDGHGSITTLIAAAHTNNASKTAGICWNVSLMVLVIADSTGSIVSAAALKAWVYAADHGAHVISASIAGAGTDPAEQVAVDYCYSKGVTICGAVGNNLSGPPANVHPGGDNHVIGVGTVDQTDHTAPTVTTVGTFVDICTPGGGGPVLQGATGTVGTGSANSWAVPMAAGACVLLKSINFGATPDLIERILKLTAAQCVGQTVIPDTTFGYGRIDVGAAAAMMQDSKLFWTAFDNFRLVAMKGGSGALNLDAGGAALKCALVTSAKRPDTVNDTLFSGAGYTEVSGSGYAAGGLAVSGGQSCAVAGGSLKFTTTTPMLWVKNAGGFTNARYAVLYDSVTSKLIAWLGLGADYGNVSASLKINPASAGMLLSP